MQALRKCVEPIHQGQIWANSQQLQYVFDTFASAPPLRVGWHRPKRERDVVKVVANGLSNRSVAEELGLGEHTVSNYLFRIYEKLGISSRVELVFYWFKGQADEHDSSVVALSAKEPRPVLINSPAPRERDTVPRKSAG